MVKRNQTLEKLPSNYFFSKIYKCGQAYQNPKKPLISLAIGDTTEPISSYVAERMAEAAKKIATKEGYRGYGPDGGLLPLRKKIAEVFYQNKFQPDDIFISDGAKCDVARLQLLFGPEIVIALQDPVYPAYFDSSILAGKGFSNGQILYLPCTKENGFFPDLEKIQPPDLFFICSPNNPTGAVATHKQLEKLVAYAQSHHSLILFDVAYRSFIQDNTLPRSIYEIEGAEKVAIEIGSFSKMAGFTGIRLGWTVVPKTLSFEDGSSIQKDWLRIVTTCFNGASILSQMGGIAALEEKGLSQIQTIIDLYLQNAKLLKKTLEPYLPVFGGDHVPFLWVFFPKKSSMEAFDEILQSTGILTAPGIGFGPSGEGYLRFSAFSHPEAIEEAAKRLKAYFDK